MLPGRKKKGKPQRRMDVVTQMVGVMEEDGR